MQSRTDLSTHGSLVQSIRKSTNSHKTVYSQKSAEEEAQRAASYHLACSPCTLAKPCESYSRKLAGFLHFQTPLNLKLHNRIADFRWDVQNPNRLNERANCSHSHHLKRNLLDSGDGERIVSEEESLYPQSQVDLENWLVRD